MGLFGNTTDTVIVEEVERATNDKVVEEDWQIIMNICDKAGKSSDDAKAWLRAIVKRLFHEDPHVALKAVTLLDACVKNSGKTFHIEVASREFENDFNKLMVKTQPAVGKKLREALKRWADNEFKTDGQLTLIPSLYNRLVNAYDFSSSEPTTKKTTPKSTDPNVVESQEEEEQILKAIQLSLKEASVGSPKNKIPSSTSSQPSSTLYPSVNNLSAFSTVNPVPAKELRKVRALYDFEAAEDNELTFCSGEILMVLDDSDPNWWKGTNQRGEGLFPANFVTADLSVEPEKFLYDKAKKMVQFKEEVKVVEKEPEEIKINEDKLNRLLHLLHEADPTNPETDTDELLGLEREVNAMGPLIDSELERVDRKHAQLTQLSADLVDAFGLYHTLMKEPQMPQMSKVGYEPIYGYAPFPYDERMNRPPLPQLYNPPQSPMVHHPNMAYNLPNMQQQQHPQTQFSADPQHYHNLTSSQGIPQHHNMLHQNPQMELPPPPSPHGQLAGMPQNLPGQTGILQNSQHNMPPGYPHMMNDRMLPSFPQGMPNMPHQSPYPITDGGAYSSQTNLQNNGPPPQQPHYVSSSTHLMH